MGSGLADQPLDALRTKAGSLGLGARAASEGIEPGREGPLRVPKPDHDLFQRPAVFNLLKADFRAGHRHLLRQIENNIEQEGMSMSANKGN